MFLWCLPISLCMFMAGCGEAGGPAADDAATVRCRTDLDCDDGAACTNDRCGDGVCRYSPRVCAVGTRCDEARDACIGSVACASDAECDDGDACVMGDRCDPSTRVCAYDGPLDGDADGEPPAVCGGGDCDDARADVNPDATEICNSRDDDCNGTVDDAPAAALCPVVGSTCMDGACRCSGGRIACPGETRCMELATSAAHCGSCGSACVGECAAGVCDESCGEVGESCCGPYDAGYCVEGECADGETCTPCGAGGESCCSDAATGQPTCREGGCMSSTGECGLCGELNTECCLGTAKCGAGLLCKSNYSGEVCRACGGELQACCEGSVCGSGLLCAGELCVPDSCRDAFDVLPADHAPLCSTATRTCVSTCAPDDLDCANSCAFEDLTPSLDTGSGLIDCALCLSIKLAACAVAAGCGTELDDLWCCRTAEYACGPYDSSCPTCETEAYYFEACDRASGCDLSSPQLTRCFPGAP